MLHTEALTKIYPRGVRANDAIDVVVGAGEVVGLLGHNAAGKTTLVNQVVGLVRPTSGRIWVGGAEVTDDPAVARATCSLQPQAHVPLTGMTPRQAVQVLGQLRGGRPSDVRRRASTLFEALDIAQWSDTSGERLSGGVRRLVAFCLAAVVPGTLVVLDEPSNDVDPVRRRGLWDQVRRLGEEGAAVLLVSHNVAEIERVIDRAVVLRRGAVVAAGTPAQLRAESGSAVQLQVSLSDGPVPVPDFPSEVALVDGTLALSLAAEAVPEALAWVQVLMRSGVAESFTLAPTTLEDVYVRLMSPVSHQGHGRAA